MGYDAAFHNDLYHKCLEAVELTVAGEQKNLDDLGMKVGDSKADHFHWEGEWAQLAALGIQTMQDGMRAMGTFGPVKFMFSKDSRERVTVECDRSYILQMVDDQPHEERYDPVRAKLETNRDVARAIGIILGKERTRREGIEAKF